MRPEKQLLLDEIRDKIDSSKAFIVARYTKLDPNLSSSFRMKLDEAASDFEVVKKRILLKAAKESGCPIDEALLDGYHIGIVYANADPLPMTKVVFKFQKDHEDVLQVLGGRFEGQTYSAKDVETLSKLPSKTELQAQLLGLFEAVPAQLLAVFDALLTSTVHCLDNKSKT
jgi:large subunit ribosomal protein L10